MRPQKARNTVSIAIHSALCGDASRLYATETKTALHKLLQKLKVELAESYDEHYDYYTPKLEEYDTQREELHYISDRFNAPHRIKFLLFGIERNLFTNEKLKKA